MMGMRGAVLAAVMMVGAATTVWAEGYGAQYAADRAEIDDLEARYMFALNWQDADGYAGTFTEDGILDWAGGIIKGREAIRAEVARMKADADEVAAKSPGEWRPQRRHFLTNYVLKIDGDHATGRAYWFELLNDTPDRSPRLPSYGHYEDELRKVNGRWLFSKRKIFNEQMKDRLAGPDNPAR